MIIECHKNGNESPSFIPEHGKTVTSTSNLS